MKPKVAFFSFTSCEGCQLQVLNLEEELPTIFGLVDIVNFREAINEKRNDYDIAFVEGSCSCEREIPELKEIREHAKIVIALGACAHTGNVNALRNFQDPATVRKNVYGDKGDLFKDSFAVRPIREVIKVDFEIPGCPINKKEFVYFLQCLLTGQTPVIPDTAVCVECKLKENICVFEKGMTCLGPVTRAGCGAWCPSAGNFCFGCRSFISHVNTNGQVEIFKKYGLTTEQAIAQFRFSGGTSDSAKTEVSK